MKKLIVLSVSLLSSLNSLFAVNNADKGSFDYKPIVVVETAIKGHLFDINHVIENVVGNNNFSFSYRLESGNVAFIQKNKVFSPKTWYSVGESLSFTSSIIPVSVGNVTLVLKVKNKRGVEKEQIISFEVKDNNLSLPAIDSVDFSPMITSGGDRASWARLQLFTNFKIRVPAFESNTVKKIIVVVNYGPIEPYTKNSFSKEFEIDYPAMESGYTTVLIGEDYKEASRGAITVEDPDFPYTTNFILKVVYNSGEVVYSVPVVKNFEVE